MDDLMKKFGPQCSTDNSFTKLMRWHQSWYRAYVLDLPYGTGPQKNNLNEYGNMLLYEDGKRGHNFLNQNIYDSVENRIREGKHNVEEYRLKCNMLSSQPMCFNLFGMMVDNLDLAATLWQRVIPSLHSVNTVRIEWAPQPKEEYLNDGTSFDAYIEFDDDSGRHAFIGIETKLTEPFSQTKKYDSEYYSRVMQESPDIWRKDILNEAPDLEINQLWRDHLLMAALKNHDQSTFDYGLFFLIRHPLDKRCDRAVERYRNLLCEDDISFLDMPLDLLLSLWRTGNLTDDTHVWLSKFSQRYLELEHSERQALTELNKHQPKHGKCTICGRQLDQLLAVYPHVVCHNCDRKALRKDGKPAEGHGDFLSLDGDEMIILSDTGRGDNPVFINGIKCWRRYKFGGWLTYRDVFNSENLKDFLREYSKLAAKF